MRLGLQTRLQPPLKANGHGPFGRSPGISAIGGILYNEGETVSAQPLETRIAHLESSVEHLNGAFDQLGKRLDDLRSDMNANFGRLDVRVERLEGRIESRFQWMLGLQMTSWLTLILAIFFKH
jgi:tetrahydromethanopterin S-methyltransferase subunit B